MGSHSERLSTAAFSSRSQVLEIVGKAQPACRVNKVASFTRLFPTDLCLPPETDRVVNVHSTPMLFRLIGIGEKPSAACWAA